MLSPVPWYTVYWLLPRLVPAAKVPLAAYSVPLAGEKLTAEVARAITILFDPLPLVQRTVMESEVTLVNVMLVAAVAGAENGAKRDPFKGATVWYMVLAA